MIRALVTRDHQYTFDRLLDGSLGRPSFALEVISYESFLTRRRVRRGSYIFCDLERLAPWETQSAAEAFASLRAADCRVLNDPARVSTRYEVLRKLLMAGINDFEVFRADEHRMPSRFPVFLRFEQNHNLPLSDLIETPEALAAALHDLPDHRVPLRSVLIVGFRGEPFEPGVYRRYSSFRIRNEVFAHHIVNQDHWVAKHGDAPAVRRAPELYEFERAFVEENRYRDVLADAFELAQIDYGRSDYGLVEGRVQVYEINTNPRLGGGLPEMPEFRIETLRHANRIFLDALAAIDQPSAGQVTLDLPSFRQMGRRSRLRYRVMRTIPRP